jgi:hypothetical protein
VRNRQPILDPWRVIGCTLELASLVLVVGALLAAVVIGDAVLNGRRP